MVESDSSIKSIILSRAFVGPASNLTSRDTPTPHAKSTSKILAKLLSIEVSLP